MLWVTGCYKSADFYTKITNIGYILKVNLPSIGAKLSVTGPHTQLMCTDFITPWGNIGFGAVINYKLIEFLTC